MTRRTAWIVVGIVAGAALALLVNGYRIPFMSYERARELPAHHLPAPSSLNV